MNAPEDRDELAKRREAAEELLAIHGSPAYRYCLAMLGKEGVRTVLPTVFGHVEEHLVESLTSIDDPSTRLTFYAVVHNRCIEFSRAGGEPPRGDDLDGDEALVIRALAELRPIGRSIVMLRSVLGLRWPEMERVCGIPHRRLIRRFCRAWRRLEQLRVQFLERERPERERPKDVSSSKDSSDSSTKVVFNTTGSRPESSKLGVSSKVWDAIRIDAREFVALRGILRRLYTEEPPRGWRIEIWDRLDQQRIDARSRAQQRNVSRSRTAKSSSETKIVVAQSETSDPTSSAKTSEPTSTTSTSSAHSKVVSHPHPTRPKIVSYPKVVSYRSWLALGILLAAVILTIYRLLQ